MHLSVHDARRYARPGYEKKMAGAVMHGEAIPFHWMNMDGWGLAGYELREKPDGNGYFRPRDDRRNASSP